MGPSSSVASAPATFCSEVPVPATRYQALNCARVRRRPEGRVRPNPGEMGQVCKLPGYLHILMIVARIPRPADCIDTTLSSSRTTSETGSPTGRMALFFLIIQLEKASKLARTWSPASVMSACAAARRRSCRCVGQAQERVGADLLVIILLLISSSGCDPVQRCYSRCVSQAVHRY